MKTGLIISGAVISGVVFLLLILKLVMSAVRKKLDIYIQERFDKSRIIDATTRANFFGRQSKGGRQLRGNGALVLTETQLCFVRAMPVKEFTIPISSIRQLSLPKSFIGKTVFAPLLCIHYRHQDGDDAMAWRVKDPQRWIDAIEALRRG